jgi:CRISPR-associated protein Csy3
MHSQKIGNALRTIDTWYPEFDDALIGPIAIEPYGAVTTLGKAFRSPKDKADFYTLFDKFALGEKLATKDQEHYVMAVLVRGGVFGQSGKE